MAANEIIAEHKRFGFHLKVYSNRIEVEEMGALMTKKRTMVLMRNIASVEKHAVLSKLTVATNDGKKHQWITGLETERIYDAIMSVL